MDMEEMGQISGRIIEELQRLQSEASDTTSEVAGAARVLDRILSELRSQTQLLDRIQRSLS